MGEEFYITLLSNSSVHNFPENKTNDFKVQLSKEIYLDGSWDVCLSDVIYPFTFFNVNDKSNKVFITYKKNEKFVVEFSSYDQPKTTDVEQQYIETIKRFEIKIKPGVYNSLKEIIDVINKSFSKRFSCNLFKNQENSSHRHIEISSEIANIVKVFQNDDSFETYIETYKTNRDNDDDDDEQDEEINSEEIDIRLENRLSLQLGFTPEDNLFLCKSSPHPASLNLGIPSEIFVYSDLIQPQLIGNSWTRVLKIIKTIDANVTFGETINREISNRSYIPVNKNKFQTVCIELRDSTGEAVNFLFGTSIIQLHFKRSSKSQKQ